MKPSALFITFFLILPASLRAEESSPPRSLKEILEMAREKNPELAAAKKSWEMAQAQVRTAKSWPDPEVGVEFWGFSRSGLDFGSAEEKWYDFSQTFPFPGKLRLRGLAAEHLAGREGENYQTVERDILSKVKEAYFNLLYTERAELIVKENIDVMRRFAKISESKYSTGKATQSDVLRAQTELSKMLNMLITAGQERETAQAMLNALLDRHPEDPMNLKEDSPSVFDRIFSDLEQMALENRPEIRAASHHVAHMNAQIKASKADYLPDLMVQYTLRTREGMTTDAIAMFKVNLPFLWYRRQHSMVESADREKEHADAMLRSATTMTRYEVKEFLTHVQSSQRLIELYKTTILPQAEQSLKVTESAYQSGRVGFLDLLDSERALINSQLEYYKSVAEFGKNIAHLERAVGKDLLE